MFELGRNSEDELDAEADIDIRALNRRSMIEFNLLFTRLCELRDTFAQ
jgi:hypothetical protein